MFHRLQLLRPLVLPLLIAMLPVLALLRWAESTDEARFERLAENWEREALSRVERFRGGDTYDNQVSRFAEELKREVTRYFRVHPQSVASLSTPLLANAFRQTFPEGHRPKGTLLFGFQYDGTSAGRVLSGEGLTATRGRIMLDFFVQCTQAESISNAERNTANRRAIGLFGDLINFDLLALHRRGRLTAVWYDGRRALMIWDVIHFKGQMLGGFIAIFPQEVVRSAHPVRHAMREINKRSASRLRMMPFLLHVKSQERRIRLSPFLAPGERQRLAPLLHRIRKGEPRQDLAEPGFVSRRLPGLLIYRDAVDMNFPYELWLVGRVPRLPPGPIRVLAMAAMFAWFGLAGLLCSRVLIFGVPIQITMRRWFFGFFLLAGVLPLSAFYLAGFFLIETSRDRQIGELIRSTQLHLEDIDIGSNRLNAAFQSIARSLTQSASWCRSAANPPVGSSSPAIDMVFHRFERGGFPLEHVIFSWFERGKRVFAHHRPPRTRDQANLKFWAPMFLGAASSLEPSRMEGIMASLDTREKNEHFAFRNAVNLYTYLDFFNLRQHVHLMESEIEQSLQCYDFIAEGGRLAFFVMFRASGRTIYRRYLHGSLNQEGLSGSLHHIMASQLQGNSFDVVHPLDGSFRSSRDGRRLTRLMEEAARSGSRQFRQASDRAFLAYPCSYMPGYALGALPSFDEINGLAHKRHLLLILGTLLLAFPIRFLGSTVSQYLLEPLAKVESALVQVAGGDLTPRVSLPRQDELGEVTKAFDGMISGLEERRRLGAFVSGALNQNVDQGDGARDRFAVLLVSDLRSFTTLSESHPPTDIVHMLNRHLEEMALAIQQEGGLIDRFIGDAVVAMFWNDDPIEAARCAVRGARGMRSRHEAIQRERARAGAFLYEMGIGLDCGRIRYGSIGSRERREQAIVGPAREHAEVLESASRHGTKTRIVISRKMRELLPNEPVERLAEGEEHELV